MRHKTQAFKLLSKNNYVRDAEGNARRAFIKLSSRERQAVKKRWVQNHLEQFSRDLISQGHGSSLDGHNIHESDLFWTGYNEEKNRVYNHFSLLSLMVTALL